MNKILLVGELNPYGADPQYALYPLPARASGARLKEILGLTNRQYLKEHDRVNLCTGAWSKPAARVKVGEILLERADQRTGFVLCGAKVATAFERLFEPFAITWSPGLQWAFLVLPHPSGLNRLWNEPGVADKAREAYEALVRDRGGRG